MSGINLNGSEFDGGQAIFNGGKSGVADNVTLSVTKKDASDTSRNPDYNFVFTDTAGQTVRKAVWLNDPTSEYFDKNVIRDGKIFKHVLKVLMGENFQLPVFADHVAMTNECMALIAKNCKDKQLAVFCNYGSASNPNKYLSVRSFTPFVTKAGVDSEKLVATPYDSMERPQASEAVSESSYGDTSDAVTDGKDPWS